MALTPMEIHNKDFPRKFRGYDPDEVDQFLDMIVEDFEKLYKENIDIKEKYRVIKEKVDSYRSIEETLKETLVTAQKTAEDVVSNAQKKAEVIVREAEVEAFKLVQQGNEKMSEIRKEQEESQKQLDVFRIKFKKLLEAEIELLDSKGIIQE
jgi:cell division initiation protein